MRTNYESMAMEVEIMDASITVEQLDIAGEVTCCSTTDSQVPSICPDTVFQSSVIEQSLAAEVRGLDVSRDETSSPCVTAPEVHAETSSAAVSQPATPPEILITSIQPVEGENQLMEGENQPTEGENQPTEGENKPTEGENQPTEGENQPTEGENKPTEGENKPTEGENQPTEGENQPTEGENQPTEGENQLMEGENQLMEGENQPTEGENQLMEGENQLMEGENQLMEGENQLMEGENQLMEGENQLMEGENQLMEGENQLTEGENQPTEGENQLMEGENQPTEGENQLMEGENQLMEGENQLMEGENQLMEGENQPTEGEGELTEGEEQPEELIPYEGEGLSEGNKPQVPGSSIQKQQVPGPSIQKQQVPGPSIQKQQVPGPSIQKQQVPGPSIQKQQVPGPSIQKQQVPGPSTQKQQVPGPSTQKQQVPGPSIQKQQEDNHTPELFDEPQNLEAFVPPHQWQLLASRHPPAIPLEEVGLINPQLVWTETDDLASDISANLEDVQWYNPTSHQDGASQVQPPSTSMALAGPSGVLQSHGERSSDQSDSEDSYLFGTAESRKNAPPRITLVPYQSDSETELEDNPSLGSPEHHLTGAQSPSVGSPEHHLTGTQSPPQPHHTSVGSPEHHLTGTQSPPQPHHTNSTAADIIPIDSTTPTPDKAGQSSSQPIYVSENSTPDDSLADNSNGAAKIMDGDSQQQQQQQSASEVDINTGQDREPNQDQPPVDMEDYSRRQTTTARRLNHQDHSVDTTGNITMETPPHSQTAAQAPRQDSAESLFPSSSLPPQSGSLLSQKMKNTTNFYWLNVGSEQACAREKAVKLQAFEILDL